MPVDNSAGLGGYIYIYADAQTSRRKFQEVSQSYSSVSIGEKIRGVYYIELPAFV
jgi:hypothetical protein